jgi:N utilization substance protein B
MKPRADQGRGQRARGGHRRRRAARRQAIDILFEADLMGRSPREILEEWRAAGRSVSDYAEQLVSGVGERREAIDRLLEEISEEWSVHRMPVVDRTILRVACYELQTGVPAAVAISEAVHAANDLSTQDSGRFVNGVLGRMVRDAVDPGRP